MLSRLRTISIGMLPLVAGIFLAGCGREPQPLNTRQVGPADLKANSELTPPQTVSPTAWRQQDLIDDEFAVEEGFRALTLVDFEPFFAKPPDRKSVV